MYFKYYRIHVLQTCKMAPKLWGSIFTVKIVHFQFVFLFTTIYFSPSLIKPQTFKQKTGFAINSILVKMHKIIFNLNLIHQVAKFGKNAKKNFRAKFKGKLATF